MDRRFSFCICACVFSFLCICSDLTFILNMNDRASCLCILFDMSIGWRWTQVITNNERLYMCVIRIWNKRLIDSLFLIFLRYVTCGYRSNARQLRFFFLFFLVFGFVFFFFASFNQWIDFKCRSHSTSELQWESFLWKNNLENEEEEEKKSEKINCEAKQKMHFFCSH